MECASRLIDKAFLHQRPRNRQLNHNGQIAAEEHRQAGGNVPEIGVIGQALKTGTVVRSRGSVFIQHLAQAMETRVGNSLLPCCGTDRQRGERQNQEGVNDDAQCGELHLPSFNLFAQVFRGTPNHQATDKDCQDGVHNHIHKANAFAAKDHVQHHVEQRHHAAQRR